MSATNQLESELFVKIERLSRKVWADSQINKTLINQWLDNFVGDACPKEQERLQMLFLLSNFLYFGSRQIRELVRAVFRDLYRYPIVEQIRKRNSDTRDLMFIQNEFNKELEATRFLGMGNPSESGCHLLYYFRQMNVLPRELFIHGHQIFTNSRTNGKAALANQSVKRFIFIDDFCGSGQQAIDYSKLMIEEAKTINSNLRFGYFALFGCSHGIEKVRKETAFDDVSSLVEFDETFKCFGSTSRFFHNAPAGIDKKTTEKICRKYAKQMQNVNPLGFDDCQLLLSFHHNTPDNTLPVFWWDEPSFAWSPIFRRFPKLYYSPIL